MSVHTYQKITNANAIVNIILENDTCNNEIGRRFNIFKYYNYT